MIRTPKNFIAAFCLLGASAIAQAVPIQINSNDVIIDYDDVDSFSLSLDGLVVDQSVLTVVPVTNGIRLQFGGHLNLYASSYFTYSSETKTADYSALFSFLPAAGKSITGYNITYTGGYSVETPGSVGISGYGMGFGDYQGGSSFSIATTSAGSIAPMLAGQLSATGEIGYIEVFDGYVEQLVGYQQVLDYCESENPDICYYRDEPIYEQVAIYRYEMDLGEASIYLDSITLTANVVPIPSSALLLASGLLGLAARKFKRK